MPFCMRVQLYHRLFETHLATFLSQTILLQIFQNTNTCFVLIDSIGARACADHERNNLSNSKHYLLLTLRIM